jgi:hypothetical protein
MTKKKSNSPQTRREKSMPLKANPQKQEVLPKKHHKKRRRNKFIWKSKKYKK